MNFISDERGQGAIEYILLAGGIIVAALIIMNIYGQMTRTTGKTLNASVDNMTSTTQNLTLTWLERAT